ncbi:glycosyltransferase [Caldisericum sp.]|uniref:glycosyltransferase n=1 Tax=Caldisericum sp. TaxID=2499687 RepID=UPI003D0F34C9
MERDGRLDSIASNKGNERIIARKIHIVFVLPALRAGGVEKVLLALIQGFLKAGFDVGMVLAKAEGELLDEVPKDLDIFDLNVPQKLRLLRSLFPLAKYFRTRKTDVVFPLFDGFELIPILAIKISRIFKNCPIIIYSAHNSSRYLDDFRGVKRIASRAFTWLSLRLVDEVLAVSDGVARDFSQRFHFPLSRINVIYNPVLTSEIIGKANEPVNNIWFNSTIPIIIGVGRLNKQKDFPTLIKAFALVRKEIDARLVILGEGKERQNLEKLAKELGISEYVWMPGFVDNPYKYMSKASVFVLSSIYEGLPTVLIEALALGIPVVSTDCQSGPSEILDRGKYGKLVPVRDAVALSRAILEMLRNPKAPKEMLQERAKYFSLENSIKGYQSLIERSLNRLHGE